LLSCFIGFTTDDSPRATTATRCQRRDRRICGTAHRRTIIDFRRQLLHLYNFCILKEKFSIFETSSALADYRNRTALASGMLFRLVMSTRSKVLFGIQARTIAVVCGLSFVIFATTQTQATPIIGGEVIVQQTGDVVATFLGSDAGYDNLLLLASPPNGLGTIFEGHVTPTFTMIDLGVFSAGTELIFELNNQAGGIFFSGPPSRNPDHVAHALVDDLAPGLTFVGFEDFFGGGDRDYNDLQFTVSNTVVRSVPDGGATVILLAGALLGLLLTRRFVYR
jgi:hypothetical protein